MSGETVQIMLVGGPLDGETHPIPAAEAGLMPRRYVPPYSPMSVASMWWLPGGAVRPEPPKRLIYKPMMVDFADWPVPSVADDGVMRYEYAGEF